jgi:hypothetical protein
VDEVDSILIDEARTPLIISGPAHDDNPRYDLADRLARHLVDKQKAWQEWDDKVSKAKQLAKGLEGDIRQAREKSQIPELQTRLTAAKAEIPSSRPSGPTTRSTTRSRWTASSATSPTTAWLRPSARPGWARSTSARTWTCRTCSSRPCGPTSSTSATVTT